MYTMEEIKESAKAFNKGREWRITISKKGMAERFACVEMNASKNYYSYKKDPFEAWAKENGVKAFKQTTYTYYAYF